MRAAAEPDVAATLLRHLTGARWFAGKGRRADVSGRTALPWLSGPGQWPAVRSEVVEVAYPASDGASDGGRPTELYQLLLAYYPSPQPGLRHAEVGPLPVVDPGTGMRTDLVAHDATADPAACRTLLARLLDGADMGEVEGEGEGGSRVVFHLGHRGPLRPDLEPRTFPGQQSNTSVLLGDVAMVKVFRRLEPGRNLDIEVHDALARTGASDVADLYGWVEGSWGHGGEVVSADLAMAVELLAGAEDGWGLALDALRRGQPFTPDAAALGVALAETHAALRRAFGTSVVAGTSVTEGMRDRLAAAAAAAPALEAHLGGLAAVADLGGTDVAVQRVHGDFHLGQTLRTPGGWKIIDFEGEPAKTLAERAAPDTVWRDVAGMLRSFDYAAASVPGAGSATWAAACRAAFLDAYADGPLSPSDAAALRAYEADKAVYEVVYEVRNRPDWVAIPLAAVAALAAVEQPVPVGAEEES